MPEDFETRPATGPLARVVSALVASGGVILALALIGRRLLGV